MARSTRVMEESVLKALTTEVLAGLMKPIRDIEVPQSGNILQL